MISLLEVRFPKTIDPAVALNGCSKNIPQTPWVGGRVSGVDRICCDSEVVKTITDIPVTVITRVLVTGVVTV